MKKEIPMKGKPRSILFDREYKGSFTIAPYEMSLLKSSRISKTIPKREFKKISIVLQIKIKLLKKNTLS